MDQSCDCWRLWKSNPPNSFAGVVRIPTLRRLARDTTRIERMISYSGGRPRSKTGMTNSSDPQENAIPRKISLMVCAPSSVTGTRKGRMLKRSCASRACGEYFRVSTMRVTTAPFGAAAPISRNTPDRLLRAST